MATQVNGGIGGGGGGGALGGAIFVELGGALTIVTPASFSGNMVTGGTGTGGGLNGSGISPDLFLMSGGNLTFNIPSGSLTISSSIDGDNAIPQIGIGGLTLIGPGTLIFTSPNTYTSTTTISNNGTVQLSGTGSLFSSGAVQVDAGSTFDISPATMDETIGNLTGNGQVLLGSNGLNLNLQVSSVFGGTISGTGSVSIVLGEETFTGPNTYSGGTTITGGNALFIAGAGSLSSVGTVTIDTSFDVFDISEANQTQTIGDLSGAGTLDLGSNTLILNTQDMPSFDGTIIGSGGVIVQSDMAGSIQTFTIPQTYSGGTTINSGQLSLVGNTAALLSTGPVTVNGSGIFDVIEGANPQTIGDLSGNGGAVEIGAVTFRVGTGNSTTYAGDILDEGLNGTFFKQGSGTLTLTGINSVANVEISQGRLNVDGTFLVATGMTVDPGAVLGGTGLIVGPIDVFGTVAPGHSIGTLNVTDITFESGGALQNELNGSGATDLLAASSSVTLLPGSILQIVPQAGFYQPGTVYTIVTSPAVINQFTTVQNTNPNLHFQVVYDPTAFIELVLLSVTPAPIPGLKGNAAKASVCLQTVPVEPDTTFVFSVLNSTLQLQAAVNLLQPSLYNALALAEENTTFSVRYTVSNRLEDLERNVCGLQPYDPYTRGPNLWLTPFGAFANQQHQNGEFGFGTSTGGLTLGFDGRCGDQFALGIGGSYTYTHIDWDSSKGDGRIQSFYGSLFGKWFSEFYFLDLAAIGAYSNYHATRNIFIAGTNSLTINRSLSNHHNGFEVDGHLKFGLRGCLPNSSHYSYFRPFVGFDYLYLHQNGFKETGGTSLNLIVQSQTAQMLRSEVGLEYATTFFSGNWRWVPEIGLSYVNEARFEGKNLHAQYVNTDCTFTVSGLSPTRNLFVPSFEISAFSDRTSINFTYEGEFVDKYWNQNVLFHWAYRF